MDELEKTVEPTWPGLVVPLEKIIDRLSVVWGIVNHLNSVKDCPQLRAAIQLVQVCDSWFVLNFSLFFNYVHIICSQRRLGSS